MAAGYDAKVWTAIRELWQVSNASWQTILDQVSDLLACEVPSISAVAKRSKVERWKKLPKKGLKKGVEKELKDSENFNPPDDEEKAIKTVASDENFNTEKTENSTPEDVKKVTGELVAFREPKPSHKPKPVSQDDVKRLVGRLRKQLENNVELIESCSDSVKATISDAMELAFDSEEEEQRAIDRLFFRNEKACSQIQKLAAALDLSINHSMKLYGLNPDDFKDAQLESSTRMTIINESQERLKRAASKREADRKRVLERMKRIESGGLEAELAAKQDEINSDNDEYELAESEHAT